MFDLQATHDSIILGETLVGEHSGNMFLIVDHQIYLNSLKLLGFLSAASQLDASASSTDLPKD